MYVPFDFGRAKVMKLGLELKKIPKKMGYCSGKRRAHKLK
jgi:hypothetical protein